MIGRTRISRRTLRPSRGVVRLMQRSEGVSAIEFGIFAPILVFALLAMVDVGLKAFERVEIDHVLRAGAEVAIVKQDPDMIQAVLESTARETFTVAGDAGAKAQQNPVTLSTTLICACSQSAEPAVDCNTVCPGSEPPFIFFDLAAAKGVDSLILPASRISRSLQVQIR